MDENNSISASEAQNTTKKMSIMEIETSQQLVITELVLENQKLKEERDEARQHLSAVKHFLNKYIAERDEAREALKHIEEYGTEEINASVELRQKLASALVERDEAREVLREVRASGDAFLPYIARKTTNRWRKAAGLEEAK